MNHCLNCGKKLKKYASKYCSNLCQAEFTHKEFIKKWKLGLVSGNRGRFTKNISGHLKRYLEEKFGEKCSVCGWDMKNPITKRVPLEIDHVDGNSENNREINLRMICPNCHSLSSNFRNLNKGKGRYWRKMKYLRQ